MMLKLIAIFLAVICTATNTAAQAVPFTGQVGNDFSGSVYVPDPTGQDVGLPESLAGMSSGWDIAALGLHFDPSTDMLQVGIETYGITGDADGDGDPGATGAGLSGVGGTDVPLFGATETFTLGLDLDDDGVIDVVSGLPLGADWNGAITALFTGTTYAPYLGFGATLPANSPLATTVPSAIQPDLEFAIPAFSDLTRLFVGPGQTHIGVHVFLGSFDDAGIGEDQLPGPGLHQVAIADLPCFPAFNHFNALGDPIPVPGGFEWTTQYGLLDGYGCCVLASLWDNSFPGWTLPWVPGSPTLRVGITDVALSFQAADIGVPPSTGFTVSCKQQAWFIPDSVPVGATIYVQIYAYPTLAANEFDHHASNRLIYVQPF